MAANCGHWKENNRLTQPPLTWQFPPRRRKLRTMTEQASIGAWRFTHPGDVQFSPFNAIHTVTTHNEKHQHIETRERDPAVHIKVLATLPMDHGIHGGKTLGHIDKQASVLGHELLGTVQTNLAVKFIFSVYTARMTILRLGTHLYNTGWINRHRLMPRHTGKKVKRWPKTQYWVSHCAYPSSDSCTGRAESTTVMRSTYKTAIKFRLYLVWYINTSWVRGAERGVRFTPVPLRVLFVRGEAALRWQPVRPLLCHF